MARSNVDVYVRMRNARQFQASVRRASGELERMGFRGAGALSTFASKADSLKNFGSQWSQNVTLPMAALGTVAGIVDVEFDKAMRSVNSIAQLSESQFQSLRSEVSQLAPEVAQSPTDLANALYDLVSSGFQADEALGILRSSATAATAGMTDAAISTKVVAGVLNAYRLPASKAQEISDLLFRTVDRGVITFEELSQSLGDVLPFASSLGVGLDEVGAATATMTKAGINAPETMTRIKAVLSSLIKPSTDLKNSIKDLGFESGEAMIHSLGFQGTLEALAKSTGGSKEELAKLFPNIRAVAGVLALTGKNSQGAQEDLEGMADAAGATDRALEQIKQSEAYKFQQLKASLEALAVEVMPPLIDVLTDFGMKLGDVVGWFRELPPGMQSAIVWGLLLVAMLGPVVWMVGVLASAVGGATIALASFAGALEVVLMFFGVSVGLAAGIAGAILLIAGAFVIAYLKVKWFREGVQSVWAWIKENWPSLFYPLTGPFGFAIKWIMDRWGGIKDFFATVGPKIGSALSNVWASLTRPFRKALTWIVGKVEWVLEKIQEITEKLPDIGINPGDAIGRVGDQITPGGSHGLFSDDGVFGIPGIPGAASGASVTGGGLLAVGEDGPEVLDLPSGAKVRPLRGDDGELSGLAGLLRLTVVSPIAIDGREVAKAVNRQVQTTAARS